MFGLFKSNPLKKLEKEYGQKLAAARDLQRKGDIKGCAQLSSEADAVLKQIQAAEAQQANDTE